MILVTGGSGFLGGHLVQRLSAQGKKLRALYKENPPAAELASLPGVEWMCCDLLDVYAVEEAMAGITEVYHCSAIISFSPHLREKMLHVNPETTANLVNEAILKGIRKMVYVSSVAALGRTSDETKEINEDQEWAESEYNSAYGLSKYLAENEVWRGVGEGLCAVIINPTVILGAGDWSKGSAQLMSVVNKEFPFYTNGIGGWVDVADVVTSMEMLMASEIESERFIISEGNHAFKKVFTMMADALNKKPPRYYGSPFITAIAWRLSALYSKITGGNSAITKETAKTAHSLSFYNNQKFLSAFPHFAYTPVNDCVKHMAAAFVLDANK